MRGLCRFAYTNALLLLEVSEGCPPLMDWAVEKGWSSVSGASILCNIQSAK